MKKLSQEEMGRLTVEGFRAMEKVPVVAVLDNVRSAGPPQKEIHKTALGAELTVEWRGFDSTLEAVETLRSEGYKIVAVEQVAGSVKLGNFKPRSDEKYALVFGNEVEGVAQEVVDVCDMALEIPQVGTKHSLNVAVTGGVVLWEFASASHGWKH